MYRPLRSELFDGSDAPRLGVLSLLMVLGALDVLDARTFPRGTELELLELRTTGIILVLPALLPLLLDPTLALLLFMSPVDSLRLSRW